MSMSFSYNFCTPERHSVSACPARRSNSFAVSASCASLPSSIATSSLRSSSPRCSRYRKASFCIRSALFSASNSHSRCPSLPLPPSLSISLPLPLRLGAQGKLEEAARVGAAADAAGPGPLKMSDRRRRRGNVPVRAAFKLSASASAAGFVTGVIIAPASAAAQVGGEGAAP